MGFKANSGGLPSLLGASKAYHSSILPTRRELHDRLDRQGSNGEESFSLTGFLIPTTPLESSLYGHEPACFNFAS